jgi:hypothetical protein
MKSFFEVATLSWNTLQQLLPGHSSFVFAKIVVQFLAA